MVADILTVGCYEQEIQGELLARSADVKSLDDKFKLMQAIESGKRARNQLTVQSSVTVQRSAHRQSRQQNASQTITSPTGCEGCSSTEHGPGTNKPQKKHCPAWSVSCEFCHIIGHLAKVCRKREKATRHRPPAMLLPPLVRLVRRHCQVIWQRLFILRALLSQTPHPHG